MQFYGRAMPTQLVEEVMADREDRAYKTTNLPTLRQNTGTPADRDLLLKLYEQTCTTWRMLVDVRFKLFALMPTVSRISLATVFSGGDSTKYFSLLSSACSLPAWGSSRHLVCLSMSLATRNSTTISSVEGERSRTNWVWTQACSVDERLRKA